MMKNIFRITMVFAAVIALTIFVSPTDSSQPPYPSSSTSSLA